MIFLSLPLSVAFYSTVFFSFEKKHLSAKQLHNNEKEELEK